MKEFLVIKSYKVMSPVVEASFKDEDKAPTLSEKECNKFPNAWRGVNALTKQVVRDLLVMINLPYSRELAGFIRYIVEYPNTIRYSEYKRSLIGKTVEDVIFEQ